MEVFLVYSSIDGYATWVIVRLRESPTCHPEREGNALPFKNASRAKDLKSANGRIFP
ncbi:MAG: hypothetical protein HZB53_16575 [Chloroflexi bacterium]|nr:hypothetical protein [Chloroflexota bacterium]